MEQTQTQGNSTSTYPQTSSDWFTNQPEEDLEIKLRDSEAKTLLDNLKKLLCQ